MPHLIAIVGPLGAGKTTAASLLPWLWKNAVERKGGRLEIFANYDLYGAHFMKDYTDWYRVAEAHGSVCVWDEAHRTFDSRRWSREENILATEILTFARKMASIQIFATPSVSRLDTRIRELIEVLIVIRRLPYGTFWDFYDFQADFAGPYGRRIDTKFLPLKKLKEIYKLNLFDTHSFVSSFPLPSQKKEIERFMEELEAAHLRGLRGGKEYGNAYNCKAV